MANHQVTTNWEKTGFAFNTVEEAVTAHLTDSSQSETFAQYESFVAGQTDFTETKGLASNGSEVAAGSPGNGYFTKRTWTEAKLQTAIAAEKAAGKAAAWPVSHYEGNGWTSTNTDIDPSSGNEYPINWLEVLEG
tara:strand:+ start:32 stop:436 length:405 start_codon:yes stop_codon:yes gene_type:complete